jgi:DNA-binding CsgD family transcriptional regulator
METHPELVRSIAAERQRALLAEGDEAAALARLTRREREVLRLLAERCSDREIAAELFITYRTATTHVASIFNKLGVNSRRDARAMALRYDNT